MQVNLLYRHCSFHLPHTLERFRILNYIIEFYKLVKFPNFLLKFDPTHGIYLYKILKSMIKKLLKQLIYKVIICRRLIRLSALIVFKTA